MDRFISVWTDYGHGHYAVIDTGSKRIIATCERHHDAQMVVEALSASPEAVERGKALAEEVPF